MKTPQSQPMYLLQPSFCPVPFAISCGKYWQYLNRSVMGKMKVVSSSNMLARKKRQLQDYFDPHLANVVTPNQRSLPKYKAPHKPKSHKKDLPQSKRLSQGKLDRRREKENSPPHRGRSNQKQSRFEQSINREYDSPSKQNEDIDFIFKRPQKKVKGSSGVQVTIERVNEHLRANRLSEAITVLTQALRVQQQNYDLIYLLGICYIFDSNYEEAIAIFEDMLRARPKKNIYLLLSVCYKKTERYEQTESILQQCITRFPKYYEAYIYRGKLYLKLKQFKLALGDFDRAIGLDGQKQIAFVGKGDCLRLMEKYEEARSLYSAALNNKKNNVSLLLRRAICSMELRKYESALDDINRLLEADFQNSEALYFKGLIFNKLKQPNDAIICYEQAIKFNTNKRAVTRAIYEITKIKIQNRDYYEALYTLERAQYLDIDEKVISRFRLFTHGVTAMMKKNYQDGVKILSQLQEDTAKPLSNFLKPLLYSTRSYGYLALEKYQNAKDDLDAMQNQFSLDLPNLYNKFICEGILACNAQKYEHALTLFSKAAKALPYRIEPAFYKAVTLICFSTKLIPKELKDKKKDYLESALRTVKKVETIENNPSLFMIRGLLQFALGNSDAALKDLDQCLTESTKPNPLVFYLIGLIFAETGRYSEAIGEFKRAIDNDEKHLLPEAYLNRAKCMLLTGEVNTGFIDLQSYMSYRPSSPEIHVWAGHLLFHIGAFEDAAKAYSNINNVSRNFEVLLYRAKCYLTCKDVLNTLANLKLMIELKSQPGVKLDYELLEGLRECSDESINNYEGVRLRMKTARRVAKGQWGALFKESDYQFYKGVTYFHDGKYEEANRNFERALNAAVAEETADFKKLSFSNRAFNYYEVLFASFLSMALFGNLAKAYKILKTLVDGLPEGQIAEDFTRFLQLVGQEKNNPFGKAGRNTDEAEFIPFPVENRLCSIFPEVLLPFRTPVRTRLFFCLPHVEKPDITPRFEQKVLEQFSMATIEIKPQAPWIRRSDQGVIFTDEVIKYDIELSQSSSSNAEEEQAEQQEQEEEQSGRQDHYRHQLSDEYAPEEQQQPSRPMNPAQLKQFFKLDKLTQQKLARINKN